MNKTFGVLAHVDAGKTTFSEQILYHNGVTVSQGRVDDKASFLDTHELEKERGITIFADQACFGYEQDRYYLIDTPGHVDFSAEMERALQILDYGILLISGTAGIQAHTVTLWKLLRQYHIPVFLFINKADIPTVSVQDIREALQHTLSDGILDFDEASAPPNMDQEAFSNIPDRMAEWIAERDDGVLEQYLSGQPVKWLTAMQSLLKQGRMVPCFSGSALRDRGIETFFRWFHYLTVTNYHLKEQDDFGARVYKIKHTMQGERLTYIKILSGTLKIKDEIQDQKINQIYRISGAKNIPILQALAGDLAAVAGLPDSLPGDGLGRQLENSFYHSVSALKAAVNFSPCIPLKDIMQSFRLLESEDPALRCDWIKETGQLAVHVMGDIQLEILQSLVKERFDYDITFEAPEVIYQETIREPVTGYGHFEPLRHYAEVVVRLEPAERGSGIHCESRCQRLPAQYQKLIMSHILEKDHRGILTGYPVTDLNIVLLDGIHHIKHTEGGDFREATYRAIRQGLEKADNILLEPVYCFTIEAPADCSGKILSDIIRLSGDFEQPVISDGQVFIRGSGPVSEFMGYGGELVRITRGNGRISLRLNGYAPCHNQDEVICKLQYNKEADTANPSSSVFCSKGTSFMVKWEEAENYMHTDIK